uniref:Uncharacterized protein n=1 Tax=Rhizophora mucronata TaxID=61149 RepID=A0A2P2LDE6_RHIMU
MDAIKAVKSDVLLQNFDPQRVWTSLIRKLNSCV